MHTFIAMKALADKTEPLPPRHACWVTPTTVVASMRCYILTYQQGANNPFATQPGQQPQTGQIQRQQLQQGNSFTLLGPSSKRVNFSALSLKEVWGYNINILAIRETKWHGCKFDDIRSHTVFISGQKSGSREFGMDIKS